MRTPAEQQDPLCDFGAVPGTAGVATSAYDVRSVYARGVLEPHFQVEVSSEGRKAVLRLKGELDVSSSAALEDELQRVNGSAVIVLDLSALEFIDSTGLGVLVKTHQRMRDEGDQLAVIEGSGQVKRLLELTGLDQQLTLIDSPEELLS